MTFEKWYEKNWQGVIDPHQFARSAWEAAQSEKQAGGTAKVPESYKEFAQRAAKNIINSADAQCFRWLLKHHSGSGKAMGGVGMRCWIGGVEFQGDDVATAILEAIDREKPTPSPDGNNGSAT